MLFDQIVFKYNIRQPGNIELRMHPFGMPHIVMVSGTPEWALNRLPISVRPLAVELWENLPGVQSLFFANGEITIQHNQTFTDNEIISAARDLILPVLEKRLEFNKAFE